MAGPRVSSFGTFLQTLQQSPVDVQPRQAGSSTEVMIRFVLRILRHADGTLPFEELRRESGLSTDEFDSLVSTLRRQRLIELTVGLAPSGEARLAGGP